MDLNKSVLEDIRLASGLSNDTVDFDTDLLIHINGAVAQLAQNGACLPVAVTDTSTTWGNLRDPLKIEGNDYFQMVPLYVMLNVKLIFDPPPPSTVEVYKTRLSELLWRLKIAYEDMTTTTTTVSY